MAQIMVVTAEVDLDHVLEVAREVRERSGIAVKSAPALSVKLSVRYMGTLLHCDTLEDVRNVVSFALDHQEKIPGERTQEDQNRKNER